MHNLTKSVLINSGVSATHWMPESVVAEREEGGSTYSLRATFMGYLDESCCSGGKEPLDLIPCIWGGLTKGDLQVDLFDLAVSKITESIVVDNVETNGWVTQGGTTVYFQDAVTS